MSGWKDDDEVTTTYGSIQLSLEQAHAAGIKTEQQRIIKLLEEEEAERLGQGGITEALTIRSIFALIKGENK